MRRGRIFIFLAIIIILGLVAVFFLQRFLPDLIGGGGGEEVSGETMTEPVIVTSEIIIVTQDVPRGTLIHDEHLGTMEFPQENILPTMFMADQKEAVVGRQARHAIDNGTPLYSGMLIELGEGIPDEGSIASLSVPKGMVAIPVPVDRLSSVAYSLRPGDHVGVIGTFVMVDVDSEFQSALPNASGEIISTGKAAEDAPSYLTVRIQPGGESAVIGRTELDPLLNELIYAMPSEEQRARFVTQILLQDAIVLRFGEFSFEDLLPEDDVIEPVPGEEGQENADAPPDQGTPEEVEQPEIKPPDVVTLIVTPQEAVTLEFLMKRDVQFTLVLRSSDDTENDLIDTEAVTFQYLLDVYNVPVPAKLPYDLEPRFFVLPPEVEEAQP